MTSTIYNILSPHIPDWQKYALRYFEEHLEAVNLTGACHLDEQETPELPRQIFMQLNEDWAAEPDRVQEVVSAIISSETDREAAVNELYTIANHLREMVGGLLGDTVLEQDYKAAKTETLWERLTDTNYKDVMAFHRDIATTLHRAMYEATEWHMAKVIEEVATSIKTMNFNNMVNITQNQDKFNKAI